jgi:hypothetical protein
MFIFLMASTFDVVMNGVSHWYPEPLSLLNFSQGFMTPWYLERQLCQQKFQFQPKIAHDQQQ